MRNRIKKNLVIIIKVFLWVLLLQFFLHTFVTYVLKLDGPVMSVIRMRKEILILVLSIFVARYLVKKLDREKLKELRQNFPLKKFVFIFVTINIIAFVISFFNSSIGNFIISIRYSMMGFFLFTLFYLISYLFFDDKTESLNLRYTKIIKYILGWALIRRWMIRLVPNLMRFLVTIHGLMNEKLAHNHLRFITHNTKNDLFVINFYLKDQLAYDSF